MSHFFRVLVHTCDDMAMATAAMGTSVVFVDSAKQKLLLVHLHCVFHFYQIIQLSRNKTLFFAGGTLRNVGIHRQMLA